MELKISSLKEEWIEQIYALEREAFSQPWSREDFRERIKNPQVCYLIAFEQEQLVAGCCLREIVGEGEITNVATATGWRRKGIGKLLLKQLLAEGEKRGISAFTLEVRASNQEAIALYQSLGFKQEGIRLGFYEKPKEDAIIMWKR